MNFSLEDTIAAIATPPGEGGLAVIRISGNRAMEVADGVFRSGGKGKKTLAQAASHTLHYGHVVVGGAVVDEVLAAVMHAPRTYTREPTVEISCHGGMLVTRRVLDAVLGAGARLAEPGEFTQRAFVNGRIDLTQAEAVADLIHARTDLALAAANRQLAGRLAARVNGVRDALMLILAHVEAHLDFPEEDIAPRTRGELERGVERVARDLEGLLSTAREGQILRQGIRVALVGRPNAGKSSLLNLLLGHRRAIVSATPGTTRDTLEEMANVRGIPVRLIDTAGLRETDDEVEREGVERSRRALAEADVVLHVVDASAGLSQDDVELALATRGRPKVLVWNKVDLPVRGDLGGAGASGGEWTREARVSCRTEEGLEALKLAICEVVGAGRVAADPSDVALNARHEDALKRAHAGLIRSLDGLRAEISLEWVASDLRMSTSAVGEVVGKTSTDDLLDLIFSQFCLGK